MVAVLIEARQHTRQPDDLRTCADDGKHLQLAHGSTFIGKVSGRCLSKTSFAQSITISVSAPVLVMLWAHPGTVSTILPSPPTAVSACVSPVSRLRKRNWAVP